MSRLATWALIAAAGLVHETASLHTLGPPNEIQNLSRARLGVRLAPRLQSSVAGAGCWEADVWGHEEFELTRAMCEKSYRNVGSMDKLYRLVQKTADRRCVSVVVMGGSITCGHSTGERGTPTWLRNLDDAFPALLERWLNQKFPCDAATSNGQAKHEVTNYCERGVGSLHWIDQVAVWHSEPDHPLWKADMVVVETGVNDVESVWKDEAQTQISDTKGVAKDNRVQIYTEILVRQLLAAPNSPAILYLEASAKNVLMTEQGKEANPPFHQDAMRNHFDVLQYYDIPQISAIGAMMPFYSRQRRMWLDKHYFADGYHPGKFGHKILAQLLVHAISNSGSQISDSSPASRRSWFTGVPDLAGDDELPALLVASQRTIDEYTKAEFKSFDLKSDSIFTDGKLAFFDNDFKVMEDVPGKPGLLSDRVGSTVTFGLGYARSSDQGMTANVGLLKSYDGMGMVSVTLSVADAPAPGGDGGQPCGDAQRAAAQVVTGPKLVDCLWPERVSIKDVARMRVPGTAPRSGCLFATFEIVEADPARAANKVKLLDFTVTL